MLILEACLSRGSSIIGRDKYSIQEIALKLKALFYCMPIVLSTQELCGMMWYVFLQTRLAIMCETQNPHFWLWCWILISVLLQDVYQEYVSNLDTLLQGKCKDGLHIICNAHYLHSMVKKCRALFFLQSIRLQSKYALAKHTHWRIFSTECWSLKCVLQPLYQALNNLCTPTYKSQKYRDLRDLWCFSTICMLEHAKHWNTWF